jgi:hypothetical protein
MCSSAWAVDLDPMNGKGARTRPSTKLLFFYVSFLFFFVAARGCLGSICQKQMALDCPFFVHFKSH